ncbi:MAG: biopolymer transporter ExbD [Pelagibacterales bacterium]|nr:biopolymer transporter ExbD [Pelagibacterales bacterium]MDG2268470.1 biopolymer transporter ExbD [Alphaproteobacteria bacterium]
MNIFHKKNKKQRSPNLVPLINIVFLLLIFFMLSGTLSKKDFFEVTPPISKTSAYAEAPELVVLISKENKIALDNTLINIKELEILLSKELKNKDIEEVLIKADGNAKSGILSEVIKHIRNAGIKRAAIVTLSIDKI